MLHCNSGYFLKLNTTPDANEMKNKDQVIK